jgi:hypothetical protein
LSRKPAQISQTHIARAIRGTLKAGLSVHRVEIDETGKIVVICGGAPAAVEHPPEDFEARLRSATGWRN